MSREQLNLPQIKGIQWREDWFFFQMSNEIKFSRKIWFNTCRVESLECSLFDAEEAIEFSCDSGMFLLRPQATTQLSLLRFNCAIFANAVEPDLSCNRSTYFIQYQHCNRRQNGIPKYFPLVFIPYFFRMAERSSWFLVEVGHCRIRRKSVHCYLLG